MEARTLEMRIDKRQASDSEIFVGACTQGTNFEAQPSLFKTSLQFRTNLVQQLPFWYRTNNLYVSLTNVSSVNSVCSDEVM